MSHNPIMSSPRPNLAHRQLVGEIMDDPALPEAQHRHALQGLRRINAFSRTVQTLFHTLRKTLDNDSDQPKRILDVACGDGDNAVRLAQLAKRHNLPWHIAACDISDRSVGFAQQRARQTGVQLHCFQADALGELDTYAYDAVINTLFLHHLENDDIVKLLTRLRSARHVIISDLVRSKRAYAATRIGVRLLSRSSVVHVDGPLSVRAALTPSELTELAKQAGLRDAVVTPSWPMRQLLTWSRPR